MARRPSFYRRHLSLSTIHFDLNRCPNLWGTFALRMILCLCLGFTSSACAVLRPAPLLVSPAVGEIAEFQDLRAGGPTAENYGAAFSADEPFILSSKVLVKVSRLGPRTLLDVSMISAPPDKLRLRALHPGDRTVFFDLVVAGGLMEISIPSERALYSGPLVGGRSPFGELFGIEPWEIPQAIRLGGQLGEIDFETSSFLGCAVLKPADEVTAHSGLRKVRVDAETALPRRAWWKKNGFKLNVRYLEWDSFGGADSDSGSELNAKPRVYPTRIVVTRNFPYCRFEIWGLPGIVPYRFPGEAAIGAFKLTPPPGTQAYPLSRFEELF